MGCLTARQGVPVIGDDEWQDDPHIESVGIADVDANLVKGATGAKLKVMAVDANTVVHAWRRSLPQ